MTTFLSRSMPIQRVVPRLSNDLAKGSSTDTVTKQANTKNAPPRNTFGRNDTGKDADIRSPFAQSGALPAPGWKGTLGETTDEL